MQSGTLRYAQVGSGAGGDEVEDVDSSVEEDSIDVGGTSVVVVSGVAGVVSGAEVELPVTGSGSGLQTSPSFLKEFQ